MRPGSHNWADKSAQNVSQSVNGLGWSVHGPVREMGFWALRS